MATRQSSCRQPTTARASGGYCLTRAGVSERQAGARLSFLCRSWCGVCWLCGCVVALVCATAYYLLLARKAHVANFARQW
eukprot:5505671-Prymnesium_polylepis.4